MLYGCFRFFMMMLGIMGIIHMCYNESYTYILFPISVVIWVIYSFFKENDDVWKQRHPEERSKSFGWLIGVDFDDEPNRGWGNEQDYYGYYGNNSFNVPESHRRSYVQPKREVYHYQDPEYKKIVPRCRRNSLVSINKVKTK